MRNRGSDSGPAATRHKPGTPRLAARVSLPERRGARRTRARERIARHATTALTPGQRAHDPLAHPAARLGWLPLLGSLLLHAAVIALGVFSSARAHGTREQIEQSVEVRLAAPPPLPPPEPQPAPLAVPPPPPAPRPERAKPPTAPKPPPAAHTEPAPPPRVVGLSLESTVEGGEGPGFAVGNTRLGQTADRAVAPDEVASSGLVTDAAKTSNAVATRIPSAGVSYAMPRRKLLIKPVYPELLKSQGIEADVTVMLSLDATGAVAGVKIVKPAPYPEFNEAARKAANAEQFLPATRDGIAIPYTFSFTYRFRLEDS